MHTLRSALTLALAAVAVTHTLHAQVIPQLINYQGRVAVGTPPVNFEGNGQFKFALVQGTGSTLLWKNDGSPGNTEPSAAVSLTVTKGLYSVLLGDTLIPNMVAIPTSVWANPDVRLRIWFNNGPNGSELLSPDQRLAPTGYASDFARLFVYSPTTNNGENTATFAALNIGLNQSHIHYGPTGDWYIRSASSNGKVFLQDSGGNVVIGTSGNPQAKLHVNGSVIIEPQNGNPQSPVPGQIWLLINP